MSRHKEVRLLLLVATIVVVATLFRLWYTVGPGRPMPVWVGAPVVEIAQAAPAPNHNIEALPGDDVLTENSAPVAPTLANRHQETMLSASERQSPTEHAQASPNNSCMLPDGKPGLDINKATQSDFDQLPGIGPVIAEAIVAERERRGGYLAVRDLLDVKGIGPARFAKLAPLVCVSTLTPA